MIFLDDLCLVILYLIIIAGLPAHQFGISIIRPLCGCLVSASRLEEICR